MPPKKHIIIIGVLCVIALGLGYWVGLPKEGSGGSGGNGEPKEPEFLKQGLVAYYPFNGNAKDESGNGNDGDVKGATLTEDRHGESARAYSFDGKDDLIEIPSSQSINAMRSLGITFWVKASKAQILSADEHAGLVTRWDQADVNDWFGIWLKVDTVGTSIWPTRNIQHFAPLQKGIWKHIVYSHDTAGASIYIDGELKGQLGKLPISLRETSIPIIIGADNYQSERMWRFFSGQLDDIRIYSRALSEAEVKELYEFEKPKTQQASTAAWVSNPSDPNNVKIERAIRLQLKKPTGELTKVDLEKVTKLDLRHNKLTEVPQGLEKLTQLRELNLDHNQLTDVKGLEKLTQLRGLYLYDNQLTNVKGLEKLTQLTLLTLEDNPDLTKAQIDQLQKALPNCKIWSNPTK